MNLATALPYLNPVYTHQPIVYIVKQLLKRHGVNINTSILQQKLHEHPHFPSLLSISDVLKEIGVGHEAYKTDGGSLPENFEGALVHLNFQGGMFAIIEKVRNGNVKILTEKAEMVRFTALEFLQVWNGITVNLNKSSTSTAVINIETYPQSIKYFIAILSAVVSIYLLKAFVPPFNWFRTIQLFLNISGLSLSWLLVLQHFNKSNALIEQLCDSKTNEGCSSVLSSKGAQLTPWLSMAEAGLMYFAGATTLTLFCSESVLYKWLSLGAPLMSFYAIYLQAYVIKQWCRLCMLAHSSIFLSAILTVFSTSLPNSESSKIALEWTLFLSPMIIWGVVAPIIRQLKNAKYYQNGYRRIKYNPIVFKSLVTVQSKTYVPQELKVFTLGNVRSTYELIFVSNPFCGPCAKAHSVIEEWLQQQLDLKITIVFTHTSDVKDPNRVFVERLASISDNGILKEALHVWFNGKGKNDFVKWADQFELKPSVIPYNEQSLLKWFEIADITATPTFFINGYKLPQTYHLGDLKYLISEM